MPELFEEVAERSQRGVVLGLWARRAVLTLFLVAVLAVLLGAIGQESSDSRTATAGATLHLDAPRVIRGGLLVQARIEVRARQAIDQPTLLLSDGWIDGVQVNTIEPQPANESSQDGRVALSYDKLDAGGRLVVWFQFQVDPTAVGRRDMSVSLLDGDRLVARVDRHQTILP